MEKVHEPLPVAGYTAQPATHIELVNVNKVAEEYLLRVIDELTTKLEIDPRWLAIARTNFEIGFMSLNRSIFRPQRVTLPDDVA